MSRPDIEAIAKRWHDWHSDLVHNSYVTKTPQNHLDIRALLDYVAELEELLRLQLKGSNVTLEDLLWGRAEAEKAISSGEPRAK